MGKYKNNINKILNKAYLKSILKESKGDKIQLNEQDTWTDTISDDCGWGNWLFNPPFDENDVELMFQICGMIEMYENDAYSDAVQSIYNDNVDMQSIFDGTGVQNIGMHPSWVDFYAEDVTDAADPELEGLTQWYNNSANCCTSLTQPIIGCTDENALNYNPEANFEGFLAWGEESPCEYSPEYLMSLDGTSAEVIDIIMECDANGGAFVQVHDCRNIEAWFTCEFFGSGCTTSEIHGGTPNSNPNAGYGNSWGGENNPNFKCVTIDGAQPTEAHVGTMVNAGQGFTADVPFLGDESPNFIHAKIINQVWYPGASDVTTYGPSIPINVDGEWVLSTYQSPQNFESVPGTVGGPGYTEGANASGVGQDCFSDSIIPGLTAEDMTGDNIYSENVGQSIVFGCADQEASNFWQGSYDMMIMQGQTLETADSFLTSTCQYCEEGQTFEWGPQTWNANPSSEAFLTALGITSPGSMSDGECVGDPDSPPTPQGQALASTDSAAWTGAAGGTETDFTQGDFDFDTECTEFYDMESQFQDLVCNLCEDPTYVNMLCECCSAEPQAMGMPSGEEPMPAAQPAAQPSPKKRELPPKKKQSPPLPPNLNKSRELKRMQELAGLNLKKNKKTK